jgi:diacylglycerol kinase (ATP)
MMSSLLGLERAVGRLRVTLPHRANISCCLSVVIGCRVSFRTLVNREGALYMPQRAIVVHSPHSGRSEKLAEAITQLEQTGVELVNTISIADLDHLPAQGTTWKEKRIDLAIAAGGDGLVGGVTTHIAESGLPLGILPLGTSNDIARALHIPQDLHEAAQVIAQGKEQQIDIGVARPAEQASHPATNHQAAPLLDQVAPQKYGFFVHALTVGVNVLFAHIATNSATRKRFGHMTYPVAALETFVRHDALDIQLKFEGLAMPQATANTQVQTSLRGRALQVAVINTPIFGGQRELAIPGSSFADRLLDIVVIEQMDVGTLGTSIAQFFGPKEHRISLPASKKRTFRHHPAELSGVPGIHHVQARGVTIMTSADPQDATLDGEVQGQTPMYVHVADEQLRVKVPDQAGAS